MNNKENIRKKYIEIRKSIKNKELKSSEIFNKVINLEEYKLAKVIAVYKNLQTEVDTNKLIKYSLSNGKEVVLPRVVDSDLKFYKIDSQESVLEKSKFGVLEPFDDKEKIINEKEIDLVIVPGVCFDNYRNRLGFGKGYYDRFLEKTKLNSIAICFEEQVLKDGVIPVTSNDIKVQKIITDKRIIEGE